MLTPSHPAAKRAVWSGLTATGSGAAGLAVMAMIGRHGSAATAVVLGAWSLTGLGLIMTGLAGIFEAVCRRRPEAIAARGEARALVILARGEARAGIIGARSDAKARMVRTRKR